ncbi:heme-binding NEAT domain protein [Paenibacillus jamilae]|jgi:heme-binding NEAT domain protein|uniref:NEAT domain-containing protein n=1 Tax=Paenibacillus TaxID=44249 RepID=UPI000D2F6610|nr:MULTISPECIES: NEAT domain-containing protein [Paenibacillus]MDP9678387.1 heme-binding NEAT domain protein [Paenibacillus jamilae]KAF6615819.1 NEAT domain-containing protein [Paenibacillus sp. EKM101P]KAF6620716.1 NEAT domain-containing protein [Paenibacillus sp. EKM102P]KAF6629095.1 NEAT domain-containing protein [Paenibacillus sp. EKM10P]KAF6644860.1 NEAT domain-containing protein [Paenibacillus sp. EKM11P]
MNMVMNRFEQFSFKRAFVALIMTALVFALMAPLSAKAAAADGTYNVDYTVLKDQTNETSRLDSYLTKPAQVTVANGKNVVRLTVKSSNLITAFKVEQNGVLQDATVVSTNTANNTRVVEFEVADLNVKVNAYAEITIPVIGYTGKYDVQLQFDEI